MNPAAIFEVLSPSTQRYDRTSNFDLYRAIPSLRHYLLVAQDRIWVEHRHRVNVGTWITEEYASASDTLNLADVGCEMPVAAIYSDVE